MGVERIKADHWSVAFKGHQPKAATLKIVGDIDFPDNHPFLEDFKFVKATAGDRAVAKFTIPSPSMLHLICCVREEHYEPIAQYKMKRLYLKPLPKPIVRRLRHSMMPVVVIFSWMTLLGVNSAMKQNAKNMRPVV